MCSISFIRPCVRASVRSSVRYRVMYFHKLFSLVQFLNLHHLLHLLSPSLSAVWCQQFCCACSLFSDVCIHFACTDWLTAPVVGRLDIWIYNFIAWHRHHWAMWWFSFYYFHLMIYLHSTSSLSAHQICSNDRHRIYIVRLHLKQTNWTFFSEPFFMVENTRFGWSHTYGGQHFSQLILKLNRKDHTFMQTKFPSP